MINEQGIRERAATGDAPESERRSWSIDERAGTITRIVDKDLGTTETVKLDSLVELLFWLAGREHDLRQFLFERFPVALYRRMEDAGEFWTGRTREGWPVKVAAADWRRVWEETEASARREWHFREEGDRGRRARPWEIGMDTYQLDYENTPEQFLQERLLRLYEPDYWRPLPENRDADRPFKIP
jgi:hypothetical protein